MSEKIDNDNLLSVVTMLGDAIDKLNNLSVYKPKERKNLYLWAYQSEDGSWWQYEKYYATDRDVMSTMGVTKVKRLDYTMIEVEND